MSLICLAPVFLSCGFIVSHHEFYDHTFIVTHYIVNATKGDVYIKFYKSSEESLLIPAASYGKSYTYSESTTSPQAGFVSYKSLSDSVQVWSLEAQKLTTQVNFIFDTITYPKNTLINAFETETFLYSDTFFISDANFINGKRWVVIGKNISE